MSQPAFWLKITPAYVIENFEALLQYVAAYNVGPDEPADSDFNRTVNYLTDVAQRYADIADNCSPETAPQWSEDNSKVYRITAAAILAEYKRGGSPHHLILGLLKMVLLLDYPTSPEFKRLYAGVINACARKAPITDIQLQFSDLEPARFSDSMLCSRVAHMRFDTSNAPRAYYEGVGTVLFGNDAVEISPLNHDNILLSERKWRHILEVNPSLFISDVDSRRPNRQNVSDLFEWWPGIIRDMKGMKPSKIKKLKTYTIGETFDVRVIARSDYNSRLVVCQSIDPDYERIEGKLLLDSVNMGVTRDDLLKFLQVGDILPAEYIAGPEFTFQIDNSFELEFKQALADYVPNNYVNAVFVSDYAFGTRWLSDIGLTVNVITRYNDYLDFDAHHHEGSVVKIKISETKLDKNGNVVCNGYFLPESEQNLDDVDPDIFRRKALDNLANYLIEFFKPSDDVAENEPKTNDIIAPRSAVSSLALLTLREALRDLDISSNDRLARLIGATALFECAFQPNASLITRREINYQSAISAFAMGEDPYSLSFSVPSEISANSRSKEEVKMISILRKYKENSLSIRQATFSEDENMRLIDQLIDASNTLIGKIDEAEISRIKKNITTKLGVGDLFVDTNSHRTFYGFENDTTEFKVSCVRPPKNLQVESFADNARTQAFIILKTVCAFLNSESGGDLLIGVNDEGYAVGIRNDIDTLFEQKVIAEPNPDRVRVYIKNIIDRAFVTNDGNVAGNAITAGNVTVNIEQSKENQYIIRIKIIPYPYDVVKIRKEAQLPGFKNVFFRSSGTSMPLDADGIRNIRLRKISKLDANESKIATILEAIDKKKQLSLGDYRSRRGLTSHRVEPHILLPDNSAFQAFDLAHKQMRLFRLSRIGKLELLSAGWEAEKKHRTYPVDIFGTMQSEEYKGSDHRVKMSDYAYMLLTEEFPSAKTSEEIVISENTDSDAKKFPWILRLTAYNPAGLNRFLSGLPDDTILL